MQVWLAARERRRAERATPPVAPRKRIVLGDMVGVLGKHCFGVRLGTCGVLESGIGRELGATVSEKMGAMMEMNWRWMSSRRERLPPFILLSLAEAHMALLGQRVASHGVGAMQNR
jgi:hypothetical protein